MPPETRLALERLRGTVLLGAGDVSEKIGYGVPAFYYRGRALVSYGAGRSHLSFYVQSPEVMEAHREDLAEVDAALAR